MATVRKTIETAEDTRVIEHPDGFYWLDPDSGMEIGPFATRAEAVADMESGGDEDLDVSESIAEVEDEIGINGWIDPDTGLPAEEFAPHIEDH
ncbi:hypothetical protein [Sulfuricystis multivorans]|uniref:hypothetical protein n=1 Tax=Sulfuricystis multivorans TaxID=2211108 RepID=UPI000F822FF6|nr:hypothetical protein [Sulfuricystis multivorans]